MIIGIDMMGGDYAPLEAVKSLQLYFSNSASPATLICIGDETLLKSLIVAHGLIRAEVIIQHASEIVGMNENPLIGYKEKRHSSIAIGLQMLAAGAIDAFISAGNTGVILVGSISTIRVVSGVSRPAIASLVPKLDGSTGVLLDVGLNTECRAEHLNDFAVLGSIYAGVMCGIKEPKVGLLNVGEEEGKGNVLSQMAFRLLKQNTAIKFIGNIEGRDIFQDKADVLVCEGFTGNIILKMAESFFDVAKKRKLEDDFMYRFNYEVVGGTPVLGVTKPVIIGHGVSSAKAFSRMVQLAEQMIAYDICGHIAEQFVLGE